MNWRSWWRRMYCHGQCVQQVPPLASLSALCNEALTWLPLEPPRAVHCREVSKALVTLVQKRPISSGLWTLFVWGLPLFFSSHRNTVLARPCDMNLAHSHSLRAAGKRVPLTLCPMDTLCTAEQIEIVGVHDRICGQLGIWLHRTSSKHCPPHSRPVFQTGCAARREFPFWSLWIASQPGTRTHNSPRLPRRQGSSATEAIGRPIRLLTKRYTWISKRKRYCQSTPILTKRMNWFVL